MPAKTKTQTGAPRASKPAAKAPPAVEVPIARPFLPSGRSVVFVRGGAPMSPDQLRLALAGVDPDNPVWRAVNQILDEEFASAALDASEPRSQEGTYPGGRMAALGELKKRLHDLHSAPVSARNRGVA